MSLELTALEKLPATVERVAGEKAPAAMRTMAARGLAPLGPADLLTAVYQLTFDADPAVQKAARQTAASLPEKILAGGLADPIDRRVLDFFARRLLDQTALLQVVLLNRAVADETFQHLARVCQERELEIIARNEERLLRAPEIIAALYLNPKTRMSTAQRAVELAVRHGITVHGIPAFSDIAREIAGAPLDEAEAARGDQAFRLAAEVAASGEELEALDPEEELARKEAEAARAELEATGEVDEIHKQDVSKKKQRIEDLSPAAKIRLATLGNAFARAVLIRDRNMLVAMAAIRSPGVSPSEVQYYASNRQLDEEVIRYIANQRTWVRLRAIKVALCNNPKCPLPVAMRFLAHLQVRELKLLSRSKGIPSALAGAAKQMLATRMG